MPAAEDRQPDPPGDVGKLTAVDADHNVVWQLPCQSADMPHPGWIRLVLEPDPYTDRSTITWWRVPDEVRLVEWQPNRE